MKKYSIETIREWAKKKGDVCLSSEYKGPHTALKWQCHKGHTWLTAPNSIRRGTWCPTCCGKHPRIEDMAAIASERGGKIIAQHIPNSSRKIEWECSGGHRWLATPTEIKRGTWCRKCGYLKSSELRKGSIEEMQEIAKNREGLYLSNLYELSENKLLWQCKKDTTGKRHLQLSKGVHGVRTVQAIPRVHSTTQRSWLKVGMGSVDRLPT